MKWRRAIAAVCAFNLLWAAVSFLLTTREGALAALVLALPPGVVGGIAAWWAVRGWAARLPPPVVTGAVWSLLGGAACLALLLAGLRILGRSSVDDHGPWLVATTGIIALAAGGVGFTRQRARNLEYAPVPRD